jgi:hypothetical protein
VAKQIQLQIEYDPSPPFIRLDRNGVGGLALVHSRWLR